MNTACFRTSVKKNEYLSFVLATPRATGPYSVGEIVTVLSAKARKTYSVNIGACGMMSKVTRLLLSAIFCSVCGFKISYSWL
ncbi:hypothetical protein D3C87_1759550 [compost metagenome]